MVAREALMQPLELVREAKIFDILPGLRDLEPEARGGQDQELEASGVLAKDGLFYVIFDNLPHIAVIDPQLSPAAAANHVIEQNDGAHKDFEDIAYDSQRQHPRFYVLIESDLRDDGTLMAKVQEYDAGFRLLGPAWLDFPLATENKGLEGLTCVHRGEETYLLGLCEGNRCRGGDEGKVPGGGRVQVFRRGDQQWERVGKIRLPETVLFEDYSSIAVAGDRVAVISQASSQLWVGDLAPSSWEVAGAGTCYALPTDADGRVVYGTAEGVSWMAPDQVVVVSDRAKKDRYRQKDQSIHIFRIPAPRA